MLFYLFSAEELRELLDSMGYSLPPDSIPRPGDEHLDRPGCLSVLECGVVWQLQRGNRVQMLGFHRQRPARRGDHHHLPGMFQ